MIQHDVAWYSMLQGGAYSMLQGGAYHKCSAHWMRAGTTKSSRPSSTENYILADEMSQPKMWTKVISDWRYSAVRLGRQDRKLKRQETETEIEIETEIKTEIEIETEIETALHCTALHCTALLRSCFSSAAAAPQ
jgi:hypothetical protein